MRALGQVNDGPVLLPMMLAYGAAALLHFVHNAIYLHDYPNLPAWLTAAGVYAAWCGTTVVGVVGYWLYRHASRGAGLVVIAIYAALGLGGLDHYAVAPISAHSLMMNLSIVVEAVCAVALLAVVASSWRRTLCFERRADEAD